ncbi:hypothetical protein ACFTAO_39210 [Paenibacillus rhizoplanae]
MLKLDLNVGMLGLEILNRFLYGATSSGDPQTVIRSLIFSFDPEFPEDAEVSGLAVSDFEHADSTAASIRTRANVMKTDFLGCDIFQAPLDF